MNFFKTFLASFLAVGLVVLVVFVILFISIAGLMVSAGNSGKQKVILQPHTVLNIELNDPIVENASTDPLVFDFSDLMPLPINASTKKMGLYQIVNAIEHAKEHEDIEGIYLNLNYALSTGWASLGAIRKALLDFKSSGKFIYAYAEIYTENTYYLASVADSIFMPPNGMMEFNGLVSNRMFYVGMFKKLEFEPLIFKVGTFKSAVEPYIQEKMSEASRQQTTEYLGDIWNQLSKELAASRKLSLEDINTLATEFIFNDGSKALEVGLIDQLAFESDVNDILKKVTQTAENADLRTVSLKKFMRVPTKKLPSSTNKIAIIFAEGAIQFGKSADGVVGSETVMKALRKARKDKSVKAVVLRVNSPGGNALACDFITDEVVRLSRLKPVIASMGDLAASGGYYISAKCDKIYAQKNTLTGSIGIFSILYDAHNTLGNKLGITFDQVETHESSGFGHPMFPMSESEKAFMQASTERGYTNFMTIVKDGRDFETLEEVDKIAQGRVWSGKRAVDLRLVDEWGDLKDALAEAAKLSGLGDDYLIELMPKAKSPIEEILDQMGQSSIEQHPLYEELKAIGHLKKLIPSSGTYALMPFELGIH